MDQVNPQPQMNGDDDLAKALNGGLQFEETPMAGSDNTSKTPAADTTAPTLDSSPLSSPVADKDDGATVDDIDVEPPAVHHVKDVAAGTSDLDKLKASALEELRPLVSKLDLPAEEKFDTLLLVIRSTDDQSLLDAAHTAAKSIPDDTRRAQALLDIIKEIDYFSSKR